MWVEALHAKLEGRGKPFTCDERDQLLERYEAPTDVPVALFLEELMDAYPHDY